jgi:hypothetical protein
MRAALAAFCFAVTIAIAPEPRMPHLDEQAAALCLLGSRMKSTYPSPRYVIIAATGGIIALASGVPADSAGLSEKSSWLLGNFTQNAPCKGDGRDPAELKVRIAADQIESKSGNATFSASRQSRIALRQIWSVIFRPGHSSAM